MSEDKFKQTLEFCKRYGLTPIPIAYQTKKPLIKWKEYQTKDATQTEIKNWFSVDNTNIGAVCKQTKNGKYLVVVDFDHEDTYHAFFGNHKELEEKTVVVQTKRGVHVYFLTNSPVQKYSIPLKDENNETKELISIQGNGGYIMLPPSIHPSGKQYMFKTENMNILTIEGDFKEELANIAKNASEKLDLKPQYSSQQINISDLLKGVGQGARNDAAIKIATYYRRSGYDQHKTITKMNEWNMNNKPSMPQKEIEMSVASAFKPTEPYGYIFISDEDDIYSLMEQLEIAKKGQVTGLIQRIWSMINVDNIQVNKGKKENYYQLSVKGSDMILNETECLNCTKFRVEYQRMFGILLPNINQNKWACILTNWLKNRKIEEGHEEISEEQEIVDAILEYLTSARIVKGKPQALYGTIFLETKDNVLVPNETIKKIVSRINRNVTLRKVSCWVKEYTTSPTKVVHTNIGKIRMWCFSPKKCNIDTSIAVNLEEADNNDN